MKLSHTFAAHAERVPADRLSAVLALVGGGVIVAFLGLGHARARSSIGVRPTSAPGVDRRCASTVDVKFYLIAMLSSVRRRDRFSCFHGASCSIARRAGHLVMVEFLVILLVGYAYVWRKGAWSGTEGRHRGDGTSRERLHDHARQDGAWARAGIAVAASVRDRVVRDRVMSVVLVPLHMARLAPRSCASARASRHDDLRRHRGGQSRRRFSS